VATLKKILCELSGRLESRKDALQKALQTPAAESDDPGNAAGKTGPETTEQAEPQCSQLTAPSAITSGDRAMTVRPQAR
jgi:hypothetical protein